MGDSVAPSPQKKSAGKRQARNRRKNAVKHIGKSKKAAVIGAAKTVPMQTITAEIGEKIVQAIDPRRTWIGRTAYAALDLGTNNCRLLIARAGNDGFTVVDAFSRVVRLGEGLTSTGKMSEEAMDRAVEALAVCAEKLKRRNVVLARSVATEACRQAVNGAQFIERVKRETGIHLDIISPKEEARLAVMGCHALLETGKGPALIFDIGGGSTELVLVSTDGVIPEIIDWVSVPWGVVSLTESESFDQEDANARLAGYAAMRDKVSASFAEFAARLPKSDGDHRLLGTSGTVTTLASVYLKLRSYDRSAVDGLHLPSEAMRGISRDLASLSPAGRAAFPTIGHERADLVVAGCAILEGILDIWPGERLGIADRGIREGILRALMASDAKRRRH
jgi:exopolyphosphatase / guanosine-5'-triphosphate,3'-diphosphate pyrophosphatase